MGLNSREKAAGQVLDAGTAVHGSVVDMPGDGDFEYSVVVVNFNTRVLLAECLRSVFAAASSGQLEVLVVDNGSNDGSADMVGTDFPRVRLLRNVHNIGFAAANNQALSAARGQIIILLNSDAALLPDALLELRAAFDKRPALGIAGLRLLNSDGKLQPSWGNFPTALDEFRFQTFIFKLWPAGFPYGRRVHSARRVYYEHFQWVDWVTGAALALRREVYDRIGGLPERGHMYGEDLEYCWRAKAAGFGIGYCPSAGAYHHLQGTAKQDYGRWIEHYTLAMLAFYAQHRPAADFRRAAYFIWAGSLLRRYLWQALAWTAVSRQPEIAGRIKGYIRAAELAKAALRSPPSTK